jgi:hypothetical protein
VDALLAQAQKPAQLWTERAISFVSGVLSSLLATWLISFFKNRRRAASA